MDKKLDKLFAKESKYIEKQIELEAKYRIRQRIKCSRLINKLQYIIDHPIRKKIRIIAIDSLELSNFKLYCCSFPEFDNFIQKEYKFNEYTIKFKTNESYIYEIIPQIDIEHKTIIYELH